MDDARRYAPATERNRDPILAVLRRVLPTNGTVLEVASGTGEHAAHFARALPGLRFQPTDPSPEGRASILAWIGQAGIPNVLPPLALDVLGAPPDGLAARYDSALCINMVHIAPWSATPALTALCAKLLPPGAPLLLYGPFRRAGAHTAPSNEAFDADLRARNPEWGVRDLEAVAAEAARAGFGPPEVEALPANNLAVTFRRL